MFQIPLVLIGGVMSFIVGNPLGVVRQNFFAIFGVRMIFALFIFAVVFFHVFVPVLVPAFRRTKFAGGLGLEFLAAKFALLNHLAPLLSIVGVSLIRALTSLSLKRRCSELKPVFDKVPDCRFIDAENVSRLARPNQSVRRHW